MGHIAHLRKQFKSINTYDYIITMIKRRKKPLLSSWKLNGSSLNKIESHSTKDAFCQVWLKLAEWFWRRREEMTPLPSHTAKAHYAYMPTFPILFEIFPDFTHCEMPFAISSASSFSLANQKSGSQSWHYCLPVWRVEMCLHSLHSVGV